MNHIKLTVVIKFFLLSSLLWPILSLNAKTIVLIDRSGSMNSLSGNSTLFDIARKKIGEIVIPNIAAESSSIWSFGDTCTGISKSDYTVNKSSLKKELDSLRQPGGLTPLYSATKAAIASLRQYDEERNLIVLTDGQDNCGGDPCAAVIKAKKEGVRLTVHAVGIDLDNKSKAMTDLKCMAKESIDGSFSNTKLNNSDDKGLSKAVEGISERILASQLATLVVKSIDSAGKENNIRYAISSSKSGAEISGRTNKPISIPAGNYTIKLSGEERQVNIQAGKSYQELFRSNLGVLYVRASCREAPVQSLMLESTFNTQTIRSNEKNEITEGYYRLTTGGQDDIDVRIEANSENIIDLPPWGRLSLDSKFEAKGLGASIIKLGTPIPVNQISVGESIWIPSGRYNIVPSNDSSAGFAPIHKVRVPVCDVVNVELVSKANIIVNCQYNGRVSVFKRGKLIASGLTNRVVLLPNKDRYRIEINIDNEKFLKVVQISNNEVTHCENFAKF